jgi:pSer/pThr/pTyr-binding forkhead associated (FHA) protein
MARTRTTRRSAARARRIDGPDDSVLVELVVFGLRGARVVALRDGDVVVVGRGSEADIRVNDSTVSRRHARFERVGAYVWVSDAGSANGIWVAGKRVTRRRVRTLEALLLGADSVATVRRPRRRRL